MKSAAKMTTHRGIGALAAIATLASIAPSEAQAQAQGGWTVTNLHPVGAKASSASGTFAGKQVGTLIDLNGFQRAVLWDDTGWIDLTPWTNLAWAYGVGGNQQVGIVHTGQLHASLWTGSAASWVDLHPAGATESEAYATSGSQQVGFVILSSGNGLHRASLWTGSAASWVNLHPEGAVYSLALGIDGSQQVGGAGFPGTNFHAGLWTGTAASWVDLHPPAATTSYTFDIDASHQVGWARVNGEYRASLWTGTAESWIDLSPAGTTFSRARGASGALQVGVAAPINGKSSAILWQGSPSSWEDLSLAIPLSWNVLDSEASDIEDDGLNQYVCGWGYNGNTKRYEALLWTRPLATTCYSDCDESGQLTIDDFICFQTLYAIGDPKSDCDASGQLDIDDFICFQTAYAIGC